MHVEPRLQWNREYKVTFFLVVQIRVTRWAERICGLQLRPALYTVRGFDSTYPINSRPPWIFSSFTHKHKNPIIFQLFTVTSSPLSFHYWASREESSKEKGKPTKNVVFSSNLNILLISLKSSAVTVTSPLAPHLCTQIQQNISFQTHYRRTVSLYFWRRKYVLLLPSNGIKLSLIYFLPLAPFSSLHSLAFTILHSLSFSTFLFLLFLLPSVSTLTIENHYSCQLLGYMYL